VLINFRLRLIVPLIILGFAFSLGTLGYWWLWRDLNGTWMDSIFMTFTTITTIGYGEIKPLGTAGRVLTMFVASTGIGSLFYLFTVLIDYLVSQGVEGGRGTRKMQERIKNLNQHYILVGLGRVGKQAAEELVESKSPFVVIDSSEEHIRFAQNLGYLTIRGDATDDDVLESAGIKNAKGLIVTIGNDATNLYIILSAKLLNPNVFIVTRVVDEDSVPKLLRAGANKAVSPYAIGGRRLAHLMLSPRAVDFFETALHRGNTALSVGEILVTPGTPTVGRSLETLRIPQKTGATLLAVLREGNPVVSPRGDVVISSGDHLLALGTGEQLEKLEALVSTGAT
jgi:voltage-gated potassium channel